jgi:hypothetical protein
MDFIHRFLLQIKASVDGENFTRQSCSDLFFCCGLGLRRRQNHGFFRLLCEALLRAGSDNQHDGFVGRILPMEFYAPNQGDQRTREEIFGGRN